MRPAATPTRDTDPSRQMAETVAARYAALPEVQAVTLGGSRTGILHSADSDLDIYVYADPPVPLAARAAIAAAVARPGTAEVGNAFWEPGDEWLDAATGLGVDVMFRSPGWIEVELDRVLDRHQASVGYSTCFWHNVHHAVPLQDPDGWFARLQLDANRPYPEPLRQAIVAKNHPVLRAARSSFLRQIETAVRRDDPVSVQHRAAAMLASYYDILFAVNRRTHPGEKRLLHHAAACPQIPAGMEPAVLALLSAAGDLQGSTVVERAHALVDGLDRLLGAEGLLPSP
ncbi:MAG: DUF4037 domain-containing protein [Chloroflexota bacterium]|nr:DUF4037 domain-containing protein [Chloroflexota bacterium]